MKIEYPIKQKSDWNKIKYLDINKGVLGEHLESLRIISRGLREEVPFVMTIFTPLSIAADLMKTNEEMKKQMKDNKEEVHGWICPECYSEFDMHDNIRTLLAKSAVQGRT